MNVNSANITPVLAAGSVSSPYYYQIEISQLLCQQSCAAVSPVFNPQFSIVSVSPGVAGQNIVTVHVEGVIAYVPCGADSCSTKSQVISQDFTIPLFTTAVPTSVTLTAGPSVNSIVTNACQSCSRHFVSETPVTLTVA